MDKDTLELIISKVAVPTNCNDIIIYCVWAAVIVICFLALCCLVCKISVLYLNKLDKKHEGENHIKLKELELKEKEVELSNRRIDLNHELQKLELGHKHEMDVRRFKLEEEND